MGTHREHWAEFSPNYVLLERFLLLWSIVFADSKYLRQGYSALGWALNPMKKKKSGVEDAWVQEAEFGEMKVRAKAGKEEDGSIPGLSEGHGAAHAWTSDAQPLQLGEDEGSAAQCGHLFWKP